jgi:hypothetical protein
MPTQTRVPGAASSEVDFELERFERTSPDRIEIAGRWYGLRGRRFVRPVLNLRTVGGSRRRAIALLEHKPWAADDGQTWLAAFAWPQGAGDVEGAELEVGPGLAVDLPPPGGKPGSQGRVSALRPHAVAPMARRIAHDGEDDGGERERGGGVSDREHAGRRAGVRDTRDRAGRDAADRGAGDRGTRGQPGRDPGDRSASDREARGDRAPGERGATDREAGTRGDADPDAARRGTGIAWESAPPRGHRAVSPPRDVLTAALAERDEATSARDQAERERIQALNERDDALSRRDAALRDADRAVAERDEAVAERERLKTELERITRERDVAYAERKRMMQDAETIERERDQAGAERDAARSELSRLLPARDHALREAELQAARADQAESERDTALSERKSAVAQRDRARRERDRAMRAAGVEPPAESPLVVPSHRAAAQDGAEMSDNGETAAADAAPPRGAPAPGAVPPGTPLPSRPMKVIGGAPSGPLPESKPLLTPVDAGRPRRLSRTRRAPSAPARWAVRVTVVLILLAVIVVLAILLASVL